MPIKIIETEKEGHRKVKTKEPKRYQGQKSDLYGTKTHKSYGLKAITGDHPIVKSLAGGVKGKPHSSKEGRLASAGRRFDKIVQRQRLQPPKPESKVSPGRPGGKGKGSPDKRWDKGDKFMTPLRAKKAVGGAAKIVPKITKRFLDFIKTGKHVDKHGVKTNVPKAAERLTGKHLVDLGKRKRIKHLGKGKASGGRIGLQHGSRPKPTGPHTWVRKKPKGVKIAIKGW